MPAVATAGMTQVSTRATKRQLAEVLRMTFIRVARSHIAGPVTQPTHLHRITTNNGSLHDDPGSHLATGRRRRRAKWKIPTCSFKRRIKAERRQKRRHIATTAPIQEGTKPSCSR